MTARPFTWRGRAGVASRVGIDGPGGQREGGRPGWKWSEAVRRDQAGNIPGPGPLGGARVRGGGGEWAGSAVMRVLSEAWGKRPKGQRATDCLQDTTPFFGWIAILFRLDAFAMVCHGLWAVPCAKLASSPDFRVRMGTGVPLRQGLYRSCIPAAVCCCIWCSGWAWGLGVA